jgi:drug/metabolite transporter (DMT)-like permease
VLVAGFEELITLQLTAGGLALGIAVALAYGTFSLLGRQLAPRYSPWTVLTYGFAFGALALLPFQFAIPLPRQIPSVTWIWFAALMFLATILPYGAYLSSLKWLPVSVASILAASEVVFGSMLAYLFFGERLRVWQVLGAVLVVSGVVLVAWKNPSRAQRRS